VSPSLSLLHSIETCWLGPSYPIDAIPATVILRPSPNGKYVAAFTQNESLQVWHTSTDPKQSLQEVNAPSLTKGIAALVREQLDSSSTPKIALAIDASEIALSDDNANRDNNIILRHANGQTVTFSVSSLIADLSFDWSGKQLAALICTDKDSCKTAELRIWNTSTGKLFSRYTVNDMATMAYMPDDKTVIVGGINAIEFVNLSTHKVTPAPFLKKAGVIQAMAVSEDGQTLVAAIAPSTATEGAGPFTSLQASPVVDLALQLWNIPTQQPLGTPLESHGVGLQTSFAFTSSGDIIDSTTGEFLKSYPIGIAHLRALACQMAHRSLSPSEWQLYAPNDPKSTLCP
jgi:WD40 repeat protein